MVMADLERAILERHSTRKAIGYEDRDFPTNRLRIGRDPIEKHAVFLER
jgi:hypothetical protein